VSLFAGAFPRSTGDPGPVNLPTPNGDTPYGVPGPLDGEERVITNSAFVPPSGTYAPYDVVGHHHAMSHLTVFACVRLLADTIASCPWYAYRPDSDGMPTKLSPQPVLIRKPVPQMNIFDWKWFMMASVCLRGNAFNMITSRDATGWPTGLMPLHPDIVSVELKGPNTQRDWYEPIYRVGGAVIQNSDMVHVRRFTMPGEPLGLSPIQVAMRAIDVGLSAEEYGRRYFHDSANPSSILTAPNPLDDHAIKQAKEAWVKSNRGRRHPAILTGGWEWKPITIPPNESQFLETQRFSESKIAQMYGVPPHLLGMTEKQTSWGTGIEQNNLGFNIYSLAGWTACFESHFTDHLPGQQYVAFDLKRLLRGDTQGRAQYYDLARRTGWMNVNEIRAEEEKPPIGPDGDIYLQPVNYAPLGYDPTARQGVLAKDPQAGQPNNEADVPQTGTGNPPSGQDNAPQGGSNR
jgi:HK97 family phage portal protein